MAIQDRALQALRRIFGDDRDAREAAESPSADALRHAPSSTYAIWGREDIGGLLSVSANLMDRYADYEAMNDYPDIRCFTGDMKVYVVSDHNVIIPTPIKDLVASTEGYEILAFDQKKKQLVAVAAEHPRISGRNAPILRLKLSNGEDLRVTPTHKIFCVEPRPGYVEAKDLKKGAFIVGARAGFETEAKSMLTVKSAGGVWLSEDPVPDSFAPEVYDITTSTHNLLVNGVVCHNSSFHYFANDATQPNMDNGRVCWVKSSDQAVVDMADTLIKRRLRLEDDLFSIAYTLCIGKGGRVWGDSLTEIQNLNAGDVVVGSSDGERREFSVKRRMDNGCAEVMRVRTKHREFFATPDHRVLTEDKHGIRSWKKISDLKCRRHPGGQRDASNTKLVIATRSGPGRLKAWDEILASDPFTQEWGNKGTPTQIQLPPTIEPWFCRLYGFLTGDGFLGGDYQVCYSRDPEAVERNDYYDDLFRKLGVEPSIRSNEEGEATIASSVQLNRLLVGLGFVNGSSKKRMPNWLYGLPEEHREAFLWGFIDADGWTSQPKTWKRSAFHFEIANYDLARDLKNLIDGLGYRSGNLRDRLREPGFKIKHRVVKTTKTSYTLTFSTFRFEQPFVAERVSSVETAGEMEVFDIEVDDPSHNFVVDGVVVHNCQYGNDFEEVLVTENGVVGLNNLSAPTMRRVEKLNGSLIGYVQDVTGRFTANQDELRRMLAGSLTIPKHVALFEDWQTCHFRMRSTTRRSPYGVCIPADGVVQTVDGPKPIIDVKIGERVFCRHAGMLRTTKVIDHVSNGVRPVFRLKTAHREIRATGNHPFLTRVGGSNRWKPLEELRVGDEIVAATSVPGLGNKPALGRRLQSFNNKTSVRLTEAGITALCSVSSRGNYGPRDAGLSKVFVEQGLTRKQMSDVLEGASSLSLGAYKAILADLGLIVAVGDFEVYHGPGASVPTLPDFVDESFCRFWGFMLGDGWLTDEQVYFARGVDDDVNEFYEDYFRSIGLDPHRTNDNTQCYVNSTVIVKLMRELGWINGCKEKRIPQWAFAQDERLRRALMRGLLDSDGWESQQSGPERHHIELANKPLVRDIKTLIDGLGWTCGNIRERAAREGKVQEEGQIIKGGPTYTITWHETPLGEDNFALEKIESIEFDCDEEVYDIGVADTDHNFLCDGLIVHNSVGEGARWIWKRLVMLEDAVMIYKLTRSPARYAFYVDVTDVPPNRVESFLKRAKRDLKKKKMVNPNNNFLDMRYNPLCLSGDTKIPLLDGSEKTLLEMVDAHERGEEQWVYSVDVNDENKLVPGKVTWAGGTRKNAQLLKITLDNGESIKVTPDHKMIRRSGEFTEAQTLKVGDSLMPYYRKRGNVSPAAPDYEMVYDPSDKKFKFVHRIVAEALGIKTGAPDSVIHHEDCNRHNNNPRNLTEMTWAAHKALHHKLSRAAAEKLIVYNKTDKARAETAATNRKYDKSAKMRAAITPEIREKQKKAAAASKEAFWADPEKKAQASKKMRYVYPTSFIEAIRQIIDEQGTKVGAPTIARIANERDLIDLLIEANPSKAGKLKKVHRDMLRWMCHSLGFKNLKEFKAALPIPHNHKVAKIELCEEREDTFTLTVDTAHNFAVCIGIFVCNSNDEDFFIAVRDGRALSRVEVLSGPDYQNTDDVEYFQRKLHGALMVPRAYMGQDAPIQGRAILCLTGDTGVPLMDGRTRTLKELADEYGPGEEFHVYSVGDNGKITVGKAHSPQVTRPNAEIWEVTLDNGKTVRGTPDHPFMMRDGSYRRLDELKEHDSLMPLYRRDSIKSRDGMAGYDQVLDPKTDKWRFTHRIAATWKWQRLLKLEGRVIHHEDFDKRNNDPRNLTDPLAEDHLDASYARLVDVATSYL